MLKKYLTKVALVIVNIPFSLGLVIILENRLTFDTPGFWVLDRVFPAVPGKDFGVRPWTGFGIDFVLCIVVVWAVYRLFRKLIHEVERSAG